MSAAYEVAEQSLFVEREGIEYLVLCNMNLKYHQKEQNPKIEIAEYCMYSSTPVLLSLALIDFQDRFLSVWMSVRIYLS